MKKLSKRFVPSQHSVKAFWSCYCVCQCNCSDFDGAIHGRNYTSPDSTNNYSNYSIGPRSVADIDA